MLPDKVAYFALDEETMRAVPFDRLCAWLGRFTIVICKATIDVRRLQDRLPNVLFVAYFGGRHIPNFTMKPFSDWDWPKEHAKRFDRKWLYWDLDGDRSFTTYDFKVVDGAVVRKNLPSGMVMLTINDETCKGYQSLFAEVVSGRGFSDAYIDSYEQFDLTDYARYRIGIDTNGDKKAEEPIEIQRAWNDEQCDRIGEALRELLGPDAVIIGNSGRRRIDPALSGITLEEYPPLHRLFPDWFKTQYGVSHKPGRNVYWVKSMAGLTWFDGQKAAGKMPMVLHGQMADESSPELRPGLRNPRWPSKA